jgi:hypothetical protein
LTCSKVNIIRTHWYEASPEIIRALILAGADTQARDSEGRLPVQLLGAKDRWNRAIYEEAVKDMESGALTPVMK